MSRFVHHIPCPTCGSRDNRAVYDDGHEYCFGCNDYKRGNMGEVVTIPYVYTRLPSDVGPVPNNQNRIWLRKYLSDDEIDEFFSYSNILNRHIYTYHKGEEDQFWEARSVNGGWPKVLNYGQKPFALWGNYKESGIVVFVEDIVSAIRLSKHFGVVALHGSTIPNSHLIPIAKRDDVKCLVFWLDNDKLTESLRLSQVCRYIKPSVSISTKEDPKAVSEEQLSEEMEVALSIVQGEFL